MISPEVSGSMDQDDCHAPSREKRTKKKTANKKTASQKDSYVTGVDCSIVKETAANSLFVPCLILSNYKPIYPQLYNVKFLRQYSGQFRRTNGFLFILALILLSVPC